MSITVNVNGFPQLPDGTLIVPTSKLALIRWGLVCGRPWWISDAAHGRWTDWERPPAGIGERAAGELIELRRVACLLGAFLRERTIGAPIETTPHFHALGGPAYEEAASRLDAAVAGQIAWSVLGVAALHHVGWTAPNLGIAPGPGARRPDYAGVDDADPARWVVLTAAAQAHAPAVPAVTSVAHTGVSACGAVVALPGEAAGTLDAYLEQPELTTTQGSGLDDLDPDRLHEQRYARFAWTLAAGLRPRALDVSGPGAPAASLRLFRLGVTGYIGVTVEVADAIEDALDHPVRGRRHAFAERMRALHRAWTVAAVSHGPPRIVEARSRRKPRLAGPVTTVIDGVPHDVTVGPDGIALVMPASIVRPQADPGPPVAYAA